ncbi:dermonecrotic toxin domain-containing protein [Pseudomonas orientalis]|uniref:dermonecrotic toxin domain-containing protein n=1 Tax=Pseudomonas orientalis TaxID=76758 RepID=UPI002FE37C5C
MTSFPEHPGAAPSSNDSLDVADDESVVLRETELRAMRHQLKGLINTYAHPSRLINQLDLVDSRCSESANALKKLLGRSPKVLKVVRSQLRKAFEIDPDSLLFTEIKQLHAPQKVDSLTDRAMLLLARPSVPININQFTTLSVKGESGRRLPYTPLEALRRVIALGLLERLGRAVSDYWGALEYGSWLTRRERWVALYQVLFADRAYIARQLDEISRAGLALVQAVIDAPTAEARQRAGGEWANVRVGQLMWPGTPAVAIPAALHFYREGDPSDAPHVVYLPGVARNFYEYPSFVALQCGLLALDKSFLNDLWQCLPLSRRHVLCRPAELAPVSGVVRGLELMEDALALGAQALLDGQWSNELACAVMINHDHVPAAKRPRPLEAAAVLARVEGNRQQLIGSARLGFLREQLLKWDQQRRHTEIIFGSAAPGLARYTLKHQVKRYEKGLVALLDPDDLSKDTPAYQEFVSLVSELKTHGQTLDRLVQGAQQRLFDVAFWAERPGGEGTFRRGTLFMNAQIEALRCEVQLQHRLKRLSRAHRDLIIEVIEQPLPSKRPDSQTQVLSVAIGNDPDAFYPLHNMWVVTTAPAVRVPLRQLPVVLCGFGMEGGVKGFSGLDALTQSLKASLSSRDGSLLWGYVERDKRNDLRAHAQRETLAVRYLPVNGKPAMASIKKLLGCYDRLYNSTEDITRLFSEVKDAEMSRALLIVKLQEQLKVPLSDAQSVAQANVELLRQVALQAKKLPVWLERASQDLRKKFRRSQRLHLSSAFAFKTRLEHQLPDLETFARRALTARLRLDGIPAQFDIDQPFIDIPDDVQGSYCGWTSGCTVGDRNIKLTPTLTRTTYSVLQLTLHNLDPLAPWTQWRLNHARFLQPQWKEQLNAAYLIRTMASLDIGGQYDSLINQVFYPPGDKRHTLSVGRIPELLNRTLHAGSEHHLLLAKQQGLTETAQSIFNTAMAARTPPDLLKNQYELQLHVLHLVGHTMQHDRYIAGIVVVRDQRSGHCVVYWPDAPPALVLTEYSSLKQAHAELNRIGAQPENTKVLASQVAPGWAFQAITHHPGKVNTLGAATFVADFIPVFVMVKGIWQGIQFVRSFSIKHLEPTALPDEIEKVTLEQIASKPQDWLAIVATSHSNALGLLYDANVLECKRRVQAASNSGKALDEYRSRRLGEQSETTRRRLVAFFSPLFGMFNDFYELLLVARRYHRFGNAHDAIDVGFMSAFLVIDLLMNFIPGPKMRGGAVVGVKRAAPSVLLGRIHRLRMTVLGGLSRSKPPPLTQLKVFDRFKVKTIPEGAVALKGPGEKGVYVKNGALFVADDTHHYPVYRRDNERSLRLKNKQVPGENELILDIHEGREWLLGADAPQPVAGSSSAALQPWPAAGPSWRPATARTVTENAIVQSSAMGDSWFSWRISPELDAGLVSAAPGVFYVGVDARRGAHYVLRVAPLYTHVRDPSNVYYRLLPRGDQAPLTGIVFITKDWAPVSAARVDIGRWTTTDIAEQPLPASYNTLTNQWRFHAPLFDRPLEQHIGTAFPTMTVNSRRFTAQRLIELSGSTRQVTATHLLNVRSTLDTWLTSTQGKIGQTDDLLRMLRPTEKPYTRIHIGYEGEAPGFTRVDFQVSGLDPSLLFGGRSVAVERSTAQRAAIKSVLEQQGFHVREVKVKHGRAMDDLIATHPNSNQLYYVSPSWVEEGSMQINTRLSDLWFNDALSKQSNALSLEGVKLALDEGRLVRIVAGIQWPTKRALSPTVYFVKVSPSPR